VRGRRKHFLEQHSPEQTPAIPRLPMCGCSLLGLHRGLAEVHVHELALRLRAVAEMSCLDVEQATSICVVRRNRHNRLASHNSNSRSTADWASKSAARASSPARLQAFRSPFRGQPVTKRIALRGTLGQCFLPGCGGWHNLSGRRHRDPAATNRFVSSFASPPLKPPTRASSISSHPWPFGRG
jgi:hypothetical protein